MYIKKASGRKEKFSEKKIIYSLKKIGVKELKINEIINELRKVLRPDMSSKKILENIILNLKKESTSLAAKYNLKNAIMNLGPSGYPFEVFFAGILESHGYKVSVGKRINGHCVDHEIDVVASKDNNNFMVECKYHNLPGTRSDLKVALYTYARFLDVKDSWQGKGNFCGAMLATNTKCTSELIKFFNCRGIKIIAWRYPEKRNMESLIEEKKLYPVTILFSLKDELKYSLLKNKIVFAKDIVNINIDQLPINLVPFKEEIISLKEEAIKLYNDL
jgi:hypothetical protein